jgi:hypothetical protein
VVLVPYVDFVGDERGLVSYPSRRSALFFLRAPGEIPWASFLLSPRQKSNRTGVAVRGASGNELTPTARVRGFLNRLSLVCELALEGPRFDGLAERKLL